MTKKEIYDQIVRLTARLKKAGMPKRIGWALAERDANKINILFDALPMYAPGIYNMICDFGEMYNETIGNSPEDNKKYSNMIQDCSYMMRTLAESGIISRIADADSVGDNETVLALIKDFNEQNSYFVGNLLSFLRSYSQYRYECKLGTEGEIFSDQEDEEHNIFLFDEEKIDPMSFFILTIIAKIHIENLFYGEKEKPGEALFENALGNITNRVFGYFAVNNYVFDCIGQGFNYPSIGELFVDAYKYYIASE